MSIRLKRIFCVLLFFVLTLASLSVGAGAIGTHDTYIRVVGFDENVNYAALMEQCAIDGSNYALQIGAIYEEQRNLKIDALHTGHEKTFYFKEYTTGAEIIAAMRPSTGETLVNKNKIDRLKSEYDIAGCVYEYLNQQGFSDTVIAGILGNMMAECGGQTLDLQWNIYDSRGSYYGLCQWSLFYNPTVNGCNVTEQLDYLMSNIEANMKYFGGDYSYFCSITDAGEAARYFGNYYERGAGARVRANNAYTALEWING